MRGGEGPGEAREPLSRARRPKPRPAGHSGPSCRTFILRLFLKSPRRWALSLTAEAAGRGGLFTRAFSAGRDGPHRGRISMQAGQPAAINHRNKTGWISQQGAFESIRRSICLMTKRGETEACHMGPGSPCLPLAVLRGVGIGDPWEAPGSHTSLGESPHAGLQGWPRLPLESLTLGEAEGWRRLSPDTTATP